MSSIQFWLSFDNGAERLRLPVNPESVRVTSPHSYNDVKVSKLGEYTVPGDPELKTFEFSSFFPSEYNPAYCEYADIPDPWEAIQKIEEWRESRKPCRLTITGTLINYDVTIRDIEYDVEKAGSPGDVYYTLILKEFKFVEFRKVDTSPQKAVIEQPPERPNQADKPTEYIVVKGDSLSKIAAKMKAKGVSIAWQQIYEKNKTTIGKNPNKIYPGQRLVI